LNVLGLGYVRLNEKNVKTFSLQARRYVFAALCSTRCQHNTGSLTRKELHGGPTDPRAASGDDGNLSRD